MRFRNVSRLAIGLLAALLAAAAPARAAAPVLMISIDGLRPSDVLDAAKRGLRIPTLRAFVTGGAYATGVRVMLPSVTYPNHTTLVTGVAPALHGIANNVVFDPLRKNADGWYWYASDIKVETLWEAVHRAGGRTASIGWPVTVGAPFIDTDIPEIWRTFVPEDYKLLAALSSGGDARIARMAEQAGPGADKLKLVGSEPENDEQRALFAAAIYEQDRPRFMTLHLTSLDHTQHLYGPGSPQANAVLERIDAAIGLLLARARAMEETLVVAIVSDHGFAPVDHDVNLMPAFVSAGLVTLDAKGTKVVSWEAEPWTAGGSAAVVLARPDDAKLQARVAALLKTLAADPANGIAAVADRRAIAAMGGAPQASFWIDFHPGYEAENALTGPIVVTPSHNKGTHGYFPSHQEMRATFMLAGIELPLSGSLGEIDMRAIAPTLAKIMGVPLPQATEAPLY